MYNVGEKGAEKYMYMCNLDGKLVFLCSLLTFIGLHLRELAIYPDTLYNTVRVSQAVTILLTCVHVCGGVSCTPRPETESRGSCSG